VKTVLTIRLCIPEVRITEGDLERILNGGFSDFNLPAPMGYVKLVNFEHIKGLPDMTFVCDASDSK
jgi:hypothetical protein